MLNFLTRSYRSWSHETFVLIPNNSHAIVCINSSESGNIKKLRNLVVWFIANIHNTKLKISTQRDFIEIWRFRLLKMIKSFISKLLVFALVFSAFAPLNDVQAAAKAEKAKKTTPVTVTLDGEKIQFDVQPVIKDGRVLVPFRAVFEAFGAYVNYDEATKTIISEKEGQEIEFKMNSKTAVVNGNQVSLDVPPSIINGRTLVPLRFIGENYDGQVNWDEATKQVTIITNDQPNKVPTVEIPVYLNNVKLSFDNPPFSLNNRTYVPLESFLKQLGDDVQFEVNGDEIFIEMDGASITIYVGRNYAQLNGNYITMNDVPILQDGIIYAPVRYISDFFGGSINVTPGTNEVRMSINRTKLRSSYLEKEEAQIVMPKNVSSASFEGNRRLMVSDNPEDLNFNTIPYQNATLWEDEVNSFDTKMDHRIYGWHVNQLGGNVKIGITIENLSQTNDLEIVNVKGIHHSGLSTWSHSDVGLPLAEAVLSNKLPNIAVGNPVVRPNETVLINEFDVENEFLIGFLKDFTVQKKSGTGNLSYKVRVVLTQVEDDLTTIKSEPVPIDSVNAHPRGVWKSSQLVTKLPVYQAGSPEVAYSISNGVTDDLLSASQSLGNSNYGVVRNPGHFGATYKVQIPVVNNTGEPKTVRIRLAARGGMYNGAIKVNNDKVYMIPNIKPGAEVANVIDYTISNSNVNLELEIMHSGGSAMPIAVDIITLD